MPALPGCREQIRKAATNGRLSSLDLVSRVLFPTPESSYTLDDFPGELIWIPKSLDPQTCTPEECIPSLFLISPSARFLVFYLHSNAEDLGRCYPFCALLRYQFQVHVLAVEYPGYGICPGGQADEESVIENCKVAFRFIREVLCWPLDGILILGRSVGTGPALAIATQQEVYGVILISPFLSVQEVCRDVIGPLANLITDRFPNKDRVPQLRSPLLVVHGKKDVVVPVTHGERLYQACKTRKRFVCPDAMQHNTNLHADANFFVLPMLQFFSLPDYCFDELRVPLWAYDKRLSTHYNKGGYGMSLQSKFCRGGEEEEEAVISRRVASSKQLVVDIATPVVDGAGFRALPPVSISNDPRLSPRADNANIQPREQSRESSRSMLQPQCIFSKVTPATEGKPEGEIGRDLEPLPAAIEDAATAAVSRYLANNGSLRNLSGKDPPEKDLPNKQRASSPRLQAKQYSEDEPPEPACEGIFSKVPKRRGAGPALCAREDTGVLPLPHTLQPRRPDGDSEDQNEEVYIFGI